MWRIAIPFLIVLILLGNETVQSQQSHQVPIKQETKNSIEGNSQPKHPPNTSTDSLIPQPINPPDNLKKEPSHETKSGANEGSEFAVLFGVKFKITDGLLALFTLLLVVVTAFLAVIAIWQGCQLKRTVKATRDSVDLARQEFLSTHRPKIRVRRIVLEEEKGTVILSLRYDMVNIGDRPAKNIAVMYEIEIRPRHDAILPNFPNAPLLSSGYKNVWPLIEAGVKVSEPATIDQAIQDEFQIERPTNSNVLYFTGFIKYEDELGIVRETGFCRKFKGLCFIRIDNPDYEYED